MTDKKGCDLIKRNVYKGIFLLLIVLSSINCVAGVSYEYGAVGGYFIPGGYYGGYSGYHYWVDYCPMCGYYDCLLYNPKGTYEGEITCAVCDADYDGCTGADKNGGGARAWLIPYEEPKSEPEPEPQPEPEPEPEPEPQSHEEVLAAIVLQHINRKLIWTL